MDNLSGILEWHPQLTYERMAHFAEAISDLIESRDSSKPPGYVAGAAFGKGLRAGSSLVAV
jgi:hypothetical protein